ncbi:MAG: TlpA family protein disulfide reductase [Mariprofundaceae bacterium]
MSKFKMLVIPALAMLLLTVPPLFAVEYQWNDAKGATHSLADFKGKPVLLHFWASWCPPCRAEMPQLQAWSSQHPEVQLIPVSLDRSIANASEYLQVENITFPALHGDSSAASRMGVRGLPSTLIINADGSIRRTELGARPWSNRRFSQAILSGLTP